MNKAILMGRLTKDPELRYAKDGNLEICDFTLAINRKLARQGDENKADFIPIVVFGKKATFCHQYFKKGRQVAVVGRIDVSSWDGQDGKKVFMTRVIADEAYFADSKPSDDSSNYKPSTNEPNTNKDNGFSVNENDEELPF